MKQKMKLKQNKQTNKKNQTERKPKRTKDKHSKITKN